MNRKIIYLTILTMFVILLTVYILIFLKLGNSKINEQDIRVIKNGRKEGYNEIINSKNIKYFNYDNSDFEIICTLNKDKIRVILDYHGKKTSYISKNDNLLKELQEIIDKYEISKNNGYEKVVTGLPSGLGDKIKITYDSNEKIYKYSNQTSIIPSEALYEIRDLFSNDEKESRE